jgi:radical SAM protein with 4Fe4S-binding SPASM domain
MRENYRDMPDLVNTLAALGVDEIALNPVIPRRDRRPHALLREDILVYNAEIAPQIAERATTLSRSSNHDDLYLYGTSRADVERAAQCRYVDRLKVPCCFKPWYYMVVRENGDVVGCNTVKHPKTRIGNVRQAAMDEIWSSAAYRTFRTSCKPPQFAECGNCCYRFALVNRQLSQILARSGV